MVSFCAAKFLTIFAAAVRLQEWMDEPSSITSMTEQDRQISEIVAEETIPFAQFHPPACARPFGRRGHRAGGLLQTGRSQSAADAD
jgi:hypothetical protein